MMLARMMRGAMRRMVASDVVSGCVQRMVMTRDVVSRWMGGVMMPQDVMRCGMVEDMMAGDVLRGVMGRMVMGRDMMARRVVSRMRRVVAPYMMRGHRRLTPYSLSPSLSG